MPHRTSRIPIRRTRPSFVTERTADAHVKNLRRKIEEDSRRPVRLVTVYGVGYKLTDGAADA